MTYYSQSLNMNRRRYVARNQNRQSFKSNEQAIGPISNTIILVVLICMLGLLYLTQVTRANSYTYKIDDLKTEQSSLQSEYDQLVLDAARLQSLERIQASKAAKSLVSTAPSQTIQ